MAEDTYWEDLEKRMQGGPLPLPDVKDEDDEYWEKYDKETSLDDTLKAMQHTNPKLGFTRAALNLPGNIKEAATDAWEAITNPQQTAESAGAMLRASRGDVDPQTAMAVQEQVKEVAEDPIETMIQNPFDTMMLAGAPSTAPIRSTMKGVRKALGAAGDELYRADMGIPKSMLDEGKDIARHGAREGIAPSRRGLNKINRVVDELNDRMNHAIANQTDNMNMINKNVVVKHFDELKAKYKNTPGGEKNIAKLNAQMDEFMNDLGNRQMVSPEELHGFKTSAYEQAYERAGPGETVDVRTGPETKGLRQAGRGAKEALKARVEGYGKINDQWAEFAKLKPFVKERVDAPKAKGMDRVIESVKTIMPGSRAGIALRKMADTEIASLVQKYSPQQVKYMMSRVNADKTMAALWAAGQYDAILKQSREEEGGGW